VTPFFILFLVTVIPLPFTPWRLFIFSLIVEDELKYTTLVYVEVLHYILTYGYVMTCEV